MSGMRGHSINNGAECEPMRAMSFLTSTVYPHYTGRTKIHPFPSGITGIRYKINTRVIRVSSLRVVV